MSVSSDALQSTFQRALHKYIASLPEKKKKRKFIVACCTTASKPVTPDSMNEAIQKMEQEHAKRPGMRTMQKILGPVVTALQDYDNILNALTSADPMPTALIWGALKIVIDGVHRFIDLFDTIRKELNLLTYQLQRINSYDTLYGEYPQLQELFCDSLINMLRFWNRVDKECDTTGYKSLLKAATSFSTVKLKNIVKDIEEDAEKIEKFVDILEATEGKAERRAAELERFRAENARVVAQAEWDAQAVWREQDEKYKQEERYGKVCAWLRADQANEDDTRQLHIHKNQHLRGTCEWVFQHPTYLAWRDGSLQPPIVWVHAPAAAGKSVLSAHLIHTLTESLGTDGAVAYHFYRFDETHTSCEILCLLASQLLDAHWVRTQCISEDIYSKTQKSARARSPEIVQELITVLVSLLPKTYLILDGLDEECKQTPRWQEAAATIDFLTKLPDSSVRVWCSSQIRPCISDKLKPYSAVDIQDSAKHDVAFYLSRDNPELSDLEVSDQDKDAVLQSLRDRAGVNFLWAAVMVRCLKETTSLADMKQFVRDGLPETLDEYYRRSFERFAKTHRPLVSKVFALVAFARRPLRIGEVCEAVGLLRAKNPRSLHKDDMPFPSSLRALLPPLMEFPQEGCSKPEECICRLFHSTVREFLLRNPAILCSGLDDTSDLIAPDVIGNTCLLYLSQNRYSRLLTRNNNSDWLDASKKPVEQHQFHVYAAKYWDKHLDEILPTEVLRRRVSAFITSVNFQTCVQVQSLWVDAQFGVWLSLNSPLECRAYLRRMFPKWFVTGTKEGKDLWLDFRAFVHEWKHFLRGPNMEPLPSYLPYKGELDRCWWPTLGRRNFLSKLNCRYTAFMFQGDDEDFLSRTGYYQFEGVGADGKELAILRLTSRANGSLVFALELWACPGNRPPTLQKAQTIVTTEKDTNWCSYVKGTKANIDRARAVVFSASNDFLRVGAQLFSRDDMGDYMSIPGFSSSSQSPSAYIEEFAVHGDVIALASRRGPSDEKMYHPGLSDDSLDLIGADLIHMEETSNQSRADHDVQSDSESDFASESNNSSTDSEDMGHETWSECSTEFSDDFGDDHITPWAGPVSDIDEDSDSDGDAFLSKTLKVELQEDEDNQGLDESSTDSESSSESDESDLDPAAIVGYGRWHDDNEDHAWSDSDAGSAGGRGWFAGTRSLARNGRFLISDIARRGGLMASISIFSRTSTGTPTRLFHFTRSIPFPLYDSPPAFHPSKSLVVWPLSAGDVLFADYLAKTYFVRKLRPSTLHTRHVFVKCHFSPCGSYIHFACLEGQKKPVSKRMKKLHGLHESPLKMALFVSTYRISSSKTSRSPPALVHRVRMDMGTALKISVSNLPFTLTWTPTDLYCTRSDETLHVRRISLFDLGKLPAREHSVLMPREPFFLPESAKRRKVHFFPPANDDANAIVIIGSEMRAGSTHVHVVAPAEAVGDFEPFGRQKDDSMYSIKSTLGIRSPPVGCYIHEETDFGGWSECSPSNLPDNLGIGQLDQRLEKFDPEDDCDLEPYIF
ncbi:hypothetical protein C8R45DRAFT_264026 [Mycena sanguinolenta]|nr:hypothetical protein C8R45DRAFT_264026 [Mycena sanguinolenta]